MFIKLGDKRINISLVKEYRPIRKSALSGEYFSIELVFANGEREEIHFFNREEERNDFLKSLDDRFLYKDQ